MRITRVWRHLGWCRKLSVAGKLANRDQREAHDHALLVWVCVSLTRRPKTGPSVMLVTWTVGMGRNVKEEAYTRAGHQQAA